jgi:Na+/H+ antiporter NhaD/arsenite permease-like protein
VADYTMAYTGLIILLLLLFVGIMVVFSKEEWDYVAFSLLFAIVAVIATILTIPDLGVNTLGDFGLGKSVTKIIFWKFIHVIEFEPIIFLISMQIIISIAERYKIFQWVALSVLRATKGNHRRFFYLMCIISSLSAAIIADITVAIIFVPLVVRACKILRINAAPYLFGISFTINIGSLYTPFSSSENILISAAFGTNVIWFLKAFSLYVFPILILTLFLLDVLLLRKIQPPDEERKKILLEIMDPSMVIVNKKQFVMNSIFFIVLIFALVLYPSAWVVAAIAAIIMTLINKIIFTDNLKHIDWKIIFFFVALFLLIGCMKFAGLFSIIGVWAKGIMPKNVLVASFTMMLMISLLSGFLAQVPTALVFIELIQNIYGTTIGDVPDLIIMGFLFGINLGSNFLPQGAACDLMTLSLAEKNKVEGFNYKTLLVRGSLVTVFHIIMGSIYLTLYALITGQLFT